MRNSDPLTALWQPGYLHELDQLVQSAADTALAALDEEIDPDIAGIRYINAFRKLHRRLEPFGRHDLDQPASWPAEADRRLCFALLGLHSTLARLEPPAEITPRKRAHPWYVGGDAAANLKELRPTVERLQKLADEIHGLVAARLGGVGPSQSGASDSELETHVTLDQAAAVVSRSKRTLERYKDRMPSPRVEGGGGKPDEWAWTELRPWLEQQFGRKLPERFPSDRLP